MVANAVKNKSVTGISTFLPYLIFVYRVSAQESTKSYHISSSMVGPPGSRHRECLSYTRSTYAIDPENYKTEVMNNLTEA